MTETTHFIQGCWLEGEGNTFSSYNPATNQLLWQGKAASHEQINTAVQSARAALYEWSAKTSQQRINIIERFSEVLNEKKEHLATTIAQETGKPLWESRTEVAAMIAKVAISITAFHQRTGITENSLAGAKAFIRHKPHGVVAIFGPYNFPGHLPNGHIIPALIAGNTVVFKPSELTPWVAQETIKLWQLAGLPSQVLNLVQGEKATGLALAQHSGIDGLFFTGSSTTGHSLHQQFSARPDKILALEMGGNNPLIVSHVDNIKAAVHDIIQSAFITTGQRCTCARRLFIRNNTQGDAILAALIQATKAIKVGFYNDHEQPFIGSMISKHAAEVMINTQRQLIALGAKPLLTMVHTSDTGFVTPGILDVSGIKNLPDDEYFGPLLQVYRYDELAQAVDEANNTRFGLSAGLLADDEAEYDYFYQHIRAGIINWNKPLTGASSAAPFGGVGASGNHRASAYYAADYCSYPVASLEAKKMSLPEQLSPGLHI